MELFKKVKLQRCPEMNSRKDCLKLILETSSLDLENSEIKKDLDIDLKRLAYFENDAPSGANAYRVEIQPSRQTFRPGLYRFTFEIQYGILHGEIFSPIGEKIYRQTETLPMI